MDLFKQIGDNLEKLIALIPKINPEEAKKEKDEFMAENAIREEQKKNLKETRTKLSNIKEGEIFLIGDDGKILTGNQTTETNDEQHAKQPEINRRAWNYGKVPNNRVTETAKAIKNAKFANSIIGKYKTLKKTAINPITADTTNSTDIDKLQKQIKCIECSIKKLELNLKLTNEDGIKDTEFLLLLEDIKNLCSNEDGKDSCDTDFNEFVGEVILKRDMNSISGLIKLASFMCPILAFANKSLFSELAETVAIPENTDQNTVGICSKIIGYITRSGNENILTLNEIKEELGLLGEAHDNGVIEGIVSFVGIGGENKSIEKQIGSSMTSIVKRTVKNTIDAALKTATFYQKFICMVFITLLSTHIYLTLCKNDNNMTNTEKLYESYVEFVYNNMTNTAMKIDFGNETITGGKKASKSRRAANAAKPRATRAAKAIAKKAAKPKPKSSSNATKLKPKAAKAAPKKKK
uniref:Uncharacterized protein n=1 Tax=viral metagenome TaxID=1070528 RepID=A0A6C0KB51_9ZZZZ